MQLVDEGKVDLDVPIRTYLPEFKIGDEAAAAQITTRQLLTHTAGFEGDIFTDTGVGDDCVEKYLGVLHEVPQLFPVGEQFSYNNAGFCVLGRLVEVLREKPYDECLREHLFAPLGLTHAATSPYEAIMFRAAIGPHRARARHRLPARAGLGAGPLERARRLDARDAPARPARVRRRCTWSDGKAADGTQVLAPGTAGRMHDTPGRPALPRPDGRLVGPRLRALRHRRRRDHRPRRRHHRPVRLPAHRPRGRRRGRAAHQRRRRHLALPRHRRPRARASSPASRLPALPTAADPPERIDASRYVGTYSAEVADLIVSQDEDGRIWLDQTPKGLFEELGEKPERKELVHYRGDSLINVEPDHGMHMPHAFVGDDGEGRALYLHVGRAVRRAGA